MDVPRRAAWRRSPSTPTHADGVEGRDGQRHGHQLATRYRLRCPTAAEAYDYNTLVTLTPTADPGSTFTGWSGDADCSDGSGDDGRGEELHGDVLPRHLHMLTVSKAGTGNGTVTSSPPRASTAAADCTRRL